MKNSQNLYSEQHSSIWFAATWQPWDSTLPLLWCERVAPHRCPRRMSRNCYRWSATGQCSASCLGPAPFRRSVMPRLCTTPPGEQEYKTRRFSRFLASGFYHSVVPLLSCRKYYECLVCTRYFPACWCWCFMVALIEVSLRQDVNRDVISK